MKQLALATLLSLITIAASAQSPYLYPPSVTRGGGTVAPNTPAQTPPPAPAPAASAICGSGRTGGFYDIQCKAVQAFFAKSGVNIEVQAYGGSQANLLELQSPSSPVFIAPVQLNDLLSVKQQIGQDELNKKAMVLAEIGKECAYMLTTDNGPVDDLDDLADEKGTLYIVGKGANSMWRVLTNAYPKHLNGINVVTEQPGALGKALDTADAVSLVQASGNKASAMLIVQLNNFPLSLDAKVMIESIEGGKLKLIPLNWRKFDDEFPGFGQPFTMEDSLLLQKGFFQRDVGTETVCTKALMLYSPGKVAKDPALSRAMGELKPVARDVLKYEPAKK